MGKAKNKSNEDAPLYLVTRVTEFDVNSAAYES